MNRVIHRGIVGLCLIALLVLGSTFVGSQPGAAAPPPPQPQWVEGPEVLIRAAEAVRSPQIRTIPQLALDGDRSAVITVHYNGTWSNRAQNAFQRAVDIWASQINSPVDIVVDAYWTSLPTGVLGAAGATTILSFSGAPVSNTWYPVALGNALSGGDLNDSTAEIEAYFNSDFPSWYFGTDGNPAGDEYDFVSVVLHELCHGLGFFGSMRVEEGVGSWGYWDSSDTFLYPMIYDRFTENGSGQALLTAFPNNSTALATQLQGWDIFFDGPYANTFNGGVRPELYAPSTWQQGSSYSHVDEIYDSTSDAMMTYAIYNGEVNHLAGPIVQGMFKDMGWTFNPHLQITSQVMGSAVGEPGGPVTFTLSVANTGAAIATGVVVTDDLPTEIESPSWSASSSLGGISERGGTSYAWDLPDLGPGATGVITIYGTLASPLPSQYVITNQATIGTAEAEVDLSDNTTSMIVFNDPLQAFLPMVLGR